MRGRASEEAALYLTPLRCWQIAWLPSEYGLSSDSFEISNCILRKALYAPSPYKRGMFTSKMPSKEYATSSARVHTLREAQHILAATLTECMFFAVRKPALGISVISEMILLKLILLPNTPL
jgi:hypothetical protein